MISEAIKGKYNNATFDTEFKLALDKGTVPKTHPRFQGADQRYRAIRTSVDKGRLRQLGLTLSADDGSVIVFEFNFGPFLSPAEMEEESTLMWQNDNINPYFFSHLLLTSGLLDNRRMTWITFHSAYDIAFFIKLATFWSPLPDSLLEFEHLIKNYLGNSVFDIKYMIKFTNNLYGGLNEVAMTLHVERAAGRAHQAGSDSLLTWHTYQKLKEGYFPHGSSVRHAGVLYGIHDI